MKPLSLAFAALATAVALRAEIVTLTGATGQPAVRYQAAATPLKPYVAEMRTPAGVQVLRDAAPDHVHHHALMFALAVDGVTFWEEKVQPGRQVSRRVQPRGDRLEQTLEWMAPDDRVLLHEERAIHLHTDPKLPATLLSWRSRLQAPAALGRVQLTGHHYYGLGARFVSAMDKQGEFVNAAGAAGEMIRGTERLANAAWCAYSSSVEGKPVTFAIFSHPANLRHPPRMFTMTSRFAYLAATLNLWKEPYMLEAGRPLELRYGVALWDGKIAHAAIEALYRHWVQLAD